MVHPARCPDYRQPFFRFAMRVDGMRNRGRTGPDENLNLSGENVLRSVVHGLLDRGKLLISKALAPARGRDYSEATLRIRVIVAALLVTAATAPLLADQRDDAKKQVQFGIEVAQRNLWVEALLRWQRAVQIDPTYAAAYNNLAIGYEHEGDLDKARAAYEKALQLEPDNALIKQNYELFKEINDRTSRDNGK